MATWDQVWADELKPAIKLLEARRSDVSSSYLTQEATLVGTNRLDVYNTEGKAAGIRSFRSRLDNVLRGGRDLLDPGVLELGTILGAPERNVATVLDRINRHMAENDLRVTSRQFSRGSWSAGGSNVGTGTIHRLCVDENGLPLEHSFADTITTEVVEDRQTSTFLGQEIFEFKGLPNPDHVTWYQAGYGSGEALRIRSFSADDTAQLLLNPSFSDYSGTTSVPEAITNWETVAGTIGTDLELVTGAANVYRAAVLEGTTPTCLKVKESYTLRQKLSTRQAKLSKTRPYYFQIAWKADGSGSWTGTLAVQIGSKTYSVTVTAQAGWNVLRCDLDKFCYLKNVNTDDLAVTITVTKTSGAGTYLLLDDIVWRTFEEFDGTYYAPVGGRTPWKYLDTGTITDVEGASNAKIQRWWHRTFDRSLPSAPAKPGAGVTATEGAAGNVDGTVKYRVTFVDQFGNESGGNATETTITVSSKIVDLSDIPLGGTGIVARKIYRTEDAGSTYYYLDTIDDNTTEEYEDDTADAGLGAATIPAGVTIEDPS